MMLACIFKRIFWMFHVEEMGLQWKLDRMWENQQGVQL